MPKPKEPGGYEVLGEPYRQIDDPIACLKQAFADYRTPDPARNFTHRIAGNRVTIYCHCHDVGLGDPGRRALYVDAMSKLTDDYIKVLKRRHRELGGGTLDLKEDKKGRGYDLQHVSLNDRWDIVYRRTYEVEGLVRNPED